MIKMLSKLRTDACQDERTLNLQIVDCDNYVSLIAIVLDKHQRKQNVKKYRHKQQFNAQKIYLVFCVEI